MGASYYPFIELKEYCVAQIELANYPNLEELNFVEIKDSLYLDAKGQLCSNKYKIVSQTINSNYVEPEPKIEYE